MNDFDDQEYSKNFHDYVALFLRRKKLLIIPAVLVFAAAVAVALYLPAVYRSTATILIEKPEVPADLVRSTVTSYAEERLHVIRQRMLATRNVSTLIDKHNLYPEMRVKNPISELVSRFRSDMEMNMISARVVSPGSGRASTATIAFTLSYDSIDPRMAQQVVNDIVTFYLAENIRERQGQAAETNKFLRQESENLASRVRELEAKLSNFKQEHAGRLPEQANLNRDMMNRTERDLQEIERKIEVLQERRILLQSQLASLNPYEALSEEGDKAISPEQKLQQLRAERSRLSGVYGDGHPDVIRLNGEIVALEYQSGIGADLSAMEAELDSAREQLADARKTYSPEHPSIVQLEATVKRLSDDLAAARLEVTSPSLNNSAAPLKNPAYSQMERQIRSTEFEIKLLQEQRTQLTVRLAEFREWMLDAPEIEREYYNLARDYDSTRAQYNETKNKQFSAELSQSLELESKSERFSLIEPPQVPSQPEKPNRLAIIGLGLIAAFGVGAGLVLLVDFLDDGIYGSRQLAALFGEPPLAAVPRIANTGDVIRVTAWRASWGVLLIGGTAAGLWAVHQYYRPLDMLWFSVLQRLSL
ncbi:MAG: lipopolysaccharide biosynthesis protein [Alphaproteobacteria bacterium]|nr:lipopolysaccharide biosynthesis protein [Alphaproteobacteria bacterium]